MKKLMALALSVLLLCSVLFVAGCGEKQETINILNWGDYMDPELLEQFEAETGIKVKQTVLTSNEEMMIKLRAADNVYDLCFPSDYVIEKLIGEDLLATLNYDNIPNVKNISEDVLAITDSFDPGNKYSIPYMWGTVGILYNTTMVSDTVNSWDILWNETYKGQVLMYDSLRDTIGLSLIRLGYDINTRSEAEVNAAADALVAQKESGMVMAYATDDIKESMINNRAALAVIYSGDALYCIGENPDLAYAVPDEGSNVWFDNMIIPKSSDKQELTEKFINFLCDAEVAKQNTEYICYSTPNAAALALLDESFTGDPTYNPPQEVLDRCTIFHDLGDFITVFSAAWERVVR